MHNVCVCDQAGGIRIITYLYYDNISTNTITYLISLSSEYTLSEYIALMYIHNSYLIRIFL